MKQRNTVQRELIQKILRYAGKHLDADEIYQAARGRSPGISLSTVYRNLQRFKGLGVVKEHQFGSRRYYELASQAEHHHLVCLGCGRVFKLRCSSTERFKSTISEEEGFRVTDTEVRLSGYCPECQERLMANSAERKTISSGEEVR